MKAQKKKRVLSLQRSMQKYKKLRQNLAYCKRTTKMLRQLKAKLLRFISNYWDLVIFRHWMPIERSQSISMRQRKRNLFLGVSTTKRTKLSMTFHTV